MHDFSIKIQNYKCFKEPSGFERIKRANIIIGRNNSGKSSLLDIIEYYLKHTSQNMPTFPVDVYHAEKAPSIIIESTLTKEAITPFFSNSTSGGVIRENHLTYGKKYIGRSVSWSPNKQQPIIIDIDDFDISPTYKTLANRNEQQYFTRAVNTLQQQLLFQEKQFIKLSAERDIRPEANNISIPLSPNGEGLTNLVQNFINQKKYDRNTVEKEMLNALNEIFEPDAAFDNIFAETDDHKWEIILNEHAKGSIALSASGSGLKTILLVLANLLLIPAQSGKKLHEYVFAFEELENNLHPALLRRLCHYIDNMSRQHDFIYFMTTHSNVMIDQYSKTADAQIVHVTQKDGVSKCKTITTYIDNKGVLDDLDVRASDLLQSNGIIWVEGPSDRVYINRWIELWSNKELKEGAHYQIIFYGGRLLSHLSAEDPEVVEEAISILNTNRNAALIIDSDKKTRSGKIGDTKKRIEKEFEEQSSMCWITKGREIENYIPVEAIKSMLSISSLEQVELYDDFFEYLDKAKPGEGTKYRSKKPILAETIVPYLTKEDITNTLDLSKQLDALCEKIRSWNSIS